MVATIKDRQDELEQLYFEIFPEEDEGQPAENPTAGTYPEINDDTLILRAKLSKNGPS
jgi:hypothetical protein